MNFPPVGPIDRIFMQNAAKLEVEALPDIRATAEKWGSTIAALTGAFGILALVEGPGRFDDLHDWAKWLSAVLVFIAVVAALFSVWKAALAAQGVPASVFNDADILRRALADRTTAAVSDLKKSRGAALVAVLFLLAAISTTWFVPTEDAYFRYTNPEAGGAPAGTYCGSLEASKEDGTISLVVKVDSKEDTRIRIIDASKLAATENCP